MIDLKQAIEHAWARERRIFLDRQHRTEAIVNVRRALSQQGSPGEVQPRCSNVAPDPHAWQAHRPRQAAGQYSVEERARLRIGLVIAIRDAQDTRAVFLQFARDIADDLFQFVDAFMHSLLTHFRPYRSIEQP